MSFDLEHGETIGLVGESGSGKSTIANIICGLLTPTTGNVVFDRQPINTPAEKRSLDFRKRIQIIFQDPLSSLNPRHRIETILTRPLKIFFGLKGKAARNRAIELLEDMELLPEHLSYKDQGRDIESLFLQGDLMTQNELSIKPAQNGTSSSSGSSQLPPTSVVAVVGQPQTSGQAFGQGTASEEPETQQEGGKCRRRTTVAGAVLLVVLAVAVVVLVVVLGGDTTQDLPQTAQFNGTARVVVLLSNVTQYMNQSHVQWFATSLVTILEDAILDVDRSFEPGWAANVEDQILLPNEAVLPSSSTNEQHHNISSLVIWSTLKIPFSPDTRHESLSMVEWLLEDAIINNGDKLLVKLAKGDSPETTPFFSQVVRVTSLEAATDFDELQALIQATPSPSTRATLPRFFSTNKELRAAVVAYSIDSAPNTTVAQRYGHPIGTWYVA